MRFGSLTRSVDGHRIELPCDNLDRLEPHAVKAKRTTSALAVERAAEILFTLAQRGNASISELALATGTTGSAVHRILTALRRKSLVEQDGDTQRYELSRAVLSLAKSLSSRADFRTVSLPRMFKLRDITHETVTLNVRSGSGRVCVEQVEGIHEIRWLSEIGRIMPLHSGVTGKVLLAFADGRDLAGYLRSLSSIRRREPGAPDRASLERDIEQIRRAGYALAETDRVAGIAAISAPIFETSGPVIAAMTVAGPAWRCRREQLKDWVSDLKSTTEEISALLPVRSS
jgi:DNA-binding IclR family transcriptional regulator